MDDIARLKHLAGITQFQGYKPVEIENISHTGTEKRELERKHNIKPGTPEWFQLWFSLPKLTGERAVAVPPSFRGRKR